MLKFEYLSSLYNEDDEYIFYRLYDDDDECIFYRLYDEDDEYISRLYDDDDEYKFSMRDKVIVGGLWIMGGNS